MLNKTMSLDTYSDDGVINTNGPRFYGVARLVPLLMAAGIGTACGQGAMPADTTDSLSQPVTSSLVSEDTPRPVASLSFDDGATVDFYDFKYGALVTGTGLAGSTTHSPGSGKASNDLTQIWRALAPEKPVPAALSDLEERLKNVTDLPPLEDKVIEETGGTPGVQEKSLDGCNNSCCDYDWLSTLDECQDSGYDNHWMLFNYGATWSNKNDIIWFDGLACAAVGTSSFHVNIAGSGGTWTVPEGYYHWYHWVAGFNTFLCAGPCGENLHSSVNTPVSDEHLHTYCGGVDYD